MNLLISPHNDDETLFASFLIQRYKPLVLIVYDSELQLDRGDPACDAKTRRLESMAACKILGAPGVAFCGLSDALDYTPLYIEEIIDQAIELLDCEIGHVFAPAFITDNHHQHNQVAIAAARRWPDHAGLRYCTYARSTGARVITDQPAKPSGAEVVKKLLALAQYKSQLNRDDCRPHFIAPLEEYYL